MVLILRPVGDPASWMVGPCGEYRTLGFSEGMKAHCAATWRSAYDEVERFVDGHIALRCESICALSCSPYKLSVSLNGFVIVHVVVRATHWLGSDPSESECKRPCNIV